MICGSLEVKKQEGGRFYLSTDFTTPQQALTLIPFDSIEFERGNGFDADNYRYVIPKKGKYLISLCCCLQDQAAGSITGCEIYINGTTARAIHNKRNNYSATEYIFVHTTVLLSLNKNDFVDGRIYNSASTTKVVESSIDYTHFDIIKLL